MAGDLTIRPATLGDADWLAPRLRQRDLDEARAAGGADVEATLYDAITRSGDLCWTVEAKRPLFVVGCAPAEGIPGLGSPWLLATDAVARYPAALTRVSRQCLAQMLAAYSALYNYVDVRNVDSVRWLELLGFTVGEPEIYGVERRLFRPFMMGNI